MFGLLCGEEDFLTSSSTSDDVNPETQVAQSSGTDPPSVSELNPYPQWIAIIHVHHYQYHYYPYSSVNP